MKIVQNLILIASLFFIATISAQGTSGKAYYIVKHKVDIDFGNRKMPRDPHRDAMMKKHINDMSKSTYVLTFNTTESTYKEEEKLEQQQFNNGMPPPPMGMMFNQGDNGEIYKNIVEKKYVSQNDIFGKQFLVKDTLTPLNWNISDEVKTIGKYTCFKATVQVETMALPKMPPPPSPDNPQEEKTEFKEPTPEKTTTTVTAWFTLDIPISNGPAKYQGLPGLILELHTDKTIFLCSKLELFKTENTIKQPTKGKKVSQQEYDEILIKKTKEAHKNFRNNRRPPPPNGGRF